MGQHDVLLERFRPVLLYDSIEAYFADHPGQLLANPGTTLRAPDGAPLAQVDDGTLTLRRLTREGFGGKRAKITADRLSIAGRDPRDQYVALRTARPEFKNHVVARAVRDPDGSLWLQYWFWYFYNDPHLAANFGLHEGDWEMIQLRMDGDDPAAAQPEIAVYAQHATAQRRSWDRVGRDAEGSEGPLVYVARGSHASYFEPGIFPTEAWYDTTDGARRSPPSTLLIVGEDPGDWAGWRGRWGDTEPRGRGLEDASPDSPCLRRQWSTPSWLETIATEEREIHPPTEGAAYDVRRQEGRLLVRYDLQELTRPAAALVVNVTSAQEPDTPPRAFTFDVRNQARGAIDTTVALDPAFVYDVRLGLTFADGEPSEVAVRTLEPGDRRGHRKVLASLGQVVAPLEEEVGRWRRRRAGPDDGS